LEAHVKRFGLFIVAVLAFGLGGAAKSNATDLIVNGSFETPNVGGSWNTFSNGSVLGWNAIDAANPKNQLIEIDYSAAAVGGPAYAGKQSLEVNANEPEDVYQTVSDLVVGQQYTLFWAYGNRPGSGSQEMQVYFGPSGTLLPADLVTTNVDPYAGTNSTLVWVPNSFVVTATSTTEVLSFNGVAFPGEGSPSYGNEIDAVSLVAAPEPSTLLFFVSGLGLLSFAWLRQRPLPVFSRL
jgi:hypothetical protein